MRVVHVITQEYYISLLHSKLTPNFHLKLKEALKPDNRGPDAVCGPASGVVVAGQ